MPRLATFGGTVSEFAEQTVDSIQHKDLRFRIYNALTATFFIYSWILFFRAVKLIDLNNLTWVDFLLFVIFLLVCLGFAVNSRKYGRSFSGYLIYPYYVSILMPVIVYLVRFLPVLGNSLIEQGFVEAFKTAIRFNKGLFSNLGFVFYLFTVVAIILAVVSLYELLAIRRLFFSLRREHYRIVRILDESLVLKIVRVMGLINLLYVAIMIVFFYYKAFTTVNYNHWITGIMTVVFAFVFINMLSNVYVMLKYETYNARTGPFLFIYGLCILLMIFTRIEGLPITRSVAGTLLSVNALGIIYFLFLSLGILISLIGSYFTKA